MWGFTAGATAGSARALPLLDAAVRYPVDDSARRVPGGKLVVEPWRLDGVTPEAVTVRVDLSRDGGQTWVEQRGRVTRGSWTTTPKRGTGPVDVRISVTDRSGSSLTRTIGNAWRD